MTRTSARNSPWSIHSSAHSAIAVSRLNDSCGEQRTMEVSVSGLSGSSTSASPAAAASAACWPAGNGSASSSCAPPRRQVPGCVVAVSPGTVAASWRRLQAPCASPVASAPAPAPADHGLLPSRHEPFPARATHQTWCQGPAPSSALPAAVPPDYLPARRAPGSRLPSADRLRF
jgi:hypothetical protein